MTYFSGQQPAPAQPTPITWVDTTPEPTPPATPTRRRVPSRRRPPGAPRGGGGLPVPVIPSEPRRHDPFHHHPDQPQRVGNTTRALPALADVSGGQRRAGVRPAAQLRGHRAVVQAGSEALVRYGLRGAGRRAGRESSHLLGGTQRIPSERDHPGRSRQADLDTRLNPQRQLSPHSSLPPPQPARPRRVSVSW